MTPAEWAASVCTAALLIYLAICGESTADDYEHEPEGNEED